MCSNILYPPYLFNKNASYQTHFMIHSWKNTDLHGAPGPMRKDRSSGEFTVLSACSVFFLHGPTKTRTFEWTWASRTDSLTRYSNRTPWRMLAVGAEQHCNKPTMRPMNKNLHQWNPRSATGSLCTRSPAGGASGQRTGQKEDRGRTKSLQHPLTYG